MVVADKGNRFEEEKKGIIIEMVRKVERFERFVGRGCCKMDDFVLKQEVEEVQHLVADSDFD